MQCKNRSSINFKKALFPCTFPSGSFISALIPCPLYQGNSFIHSIRPWQSEDMIHLNNYKKNNNRIKLTTTIFTLAIIMATSTMAAPASATTTTETMQQPVIVATDNQSVNVLISWEPAVIESGQDTEFSLDFQDPSSGESISHVNYNFEIIDQNTGEAVESMTDVHTHSGTDEQTVTFDTTGGFNLVVTIIGTGIDPPFDTTHSGTAQTVIPIGQQIAGPTGGTNTTGTTVNMTAPTVDVTTGAQTACDPTQMATGGGDGGNNSTAGNTTTAQITTMTANATTAGGGNQTTSSPAQLIEQACMAALNNDTQGVLTNLNSALDALGDNMTTTVGSIEVEDEGETE